MSPSKTSGDGGIDLPTLLITAAASAGAAYVCSKVWAPGTLASAAFTPVLVALLKEALSRPTKVVTRAVPVRGVVRSATHDDARGEPAAPTAPDVDRVAQSGELAGRSQPPRRFAWRAAIVTGLLGFLLAAVIITVPELVAGTAASGGDRGTTFFGGEGRTRSEPTQTQTTTRPGETLSVPKAETVTVPPAETVTVPPAETTTVPPAETTTVPPATTTTVPGQPPPPG